MYILCERLYNENKKKLGNLYEKITKVQNYYDLKILSEFFVF